MVDTDHVSMRLKKGFRLLTLGWTNEVYYGAFANIA